ncbi:MULTISPECIES: histidine phosphatase family protein [Gulosibacter]|uniref:histidine phosphatase family protein n=1 Tax=Gulosibacter TaxID=256818 RepID=UPI000F633CC3|nr:MULTISPECIES: histidine phosphatase family protein [Gulosibacter]
MRIGLIRHGETEWNRKALFQGTSDVPLNDTGYDQARRTAVLLEGQRWSALFCSPLTRTTQTATELGRISGLGEPTPLPDIIERSFGELEGESVFLPDGTRRLADHPTVEPVAAVLERTYRALEQVSTTCASDALIVTHGTVVRLLLNDLLTVASPAINNLALTVLETDPDARHGFRVRLANGYPVAAELTHSV